VPRNRAGVSRGRATSVQPHVAASTINRKLSALSAFYAHQVRHGVDVGELLTTWQWPGRRGGWKPFLRHISKNKPQPRRTITVKTPKKLPRILTVAEKQSIVDSCDRLRDRCLLLVVGQRGSNRRGVRSGTPTSPPPSVKSRSCRGSITTARGPSRATDAGGRCRYLVAMM
jgi:integrase